MTDSSQSKLKHESHLVLDQPILRAPYELCRKSFKTAQGAVEKDCTAVQNSLKVTATASLQNSMSPDEVLQSLESMISRMQSLKDRLASCSRDEEDFQTCSQARIRHLGELYNIKSMDDDEYSQWSRVRLDRLLVDYLLQKGYCNSAASLARKRQIDQLVDTKIFLRLKGITDGLQDHRLNTALEWCHENRKELKRLDSRLEFDLRCQQYVELVRLQDQTKLMEAISHAKKHLLPLKSKYPKEVKELAALLAFSPDVDYAPYHGFYSDKRWYDLAEAFIKTHNTLLSMPDKPILQIALSAGLSALKTRSCHSEGGNTSAHSSSANDPACSCPICSKELNQLAMGAPCALHTSSKVDHDSVVLPNSRVYGQGKLENYAKKAGLPVGLVKDLSTGEIFSLDKIERVYLS